MKYFKSGDILLSDFDGVLLDSQDKFKEVMKDEVDFNKWFEYLTSINWETFFKECNEIPNAVKVLTELERLNILKGFITKIHSLEEGEEKSKIIREMNFIVPIFYVLPHQKKSKIYIPSNNTILLDDNINNCVDWILNGGKSIFYNSNGLHSKVKTINNIKDLLK